MIQTALLDYIGTQLFRVAGHPQPRLIVALPGMLVIIKDQVELIAVQPRPSVFAPVMNKF